MKAMVGLVLAILIIFGFRLFWPSSDSGLTNAVQVQEADISESPENSNVISDVSVNDEGSALPELNEPSDDEKTKLMTAEYEILEQSRKKLKRHLAQLKHEMWGLKFPKEIATKMSKTVMSASKLLKNPHMLGAFSSVEQIKDEIAKVEFAEKSLEEIDEIVKAKIEESNSQEQASSATQ
jgi:hypothetical protein